jgi:ABC-type transport system involved in multi-copper enzyme maturation permease subunit
MTTNTQNASRTHPSWMSRFWGVVRYEMIWNIRKKKFIGIVIVTFVFATLGLVLPPILSNVTGQAITSNPDYAVTFSAGGFGFFLFALATAMNSISSEFESGTIVPLLTKPVSRTMVFLGKLLAVFIMILLIGTIMFTYAVIGGTVVYGPQSNLQLVPLALLGNVISTFIWVAIILAMGALSRNTMIAALVGFGVFLALFIALPTVSVFLGPSTGLNYVPGNGATGTMNITQGSKLIAMSIASGTDNIGVNFANYILYPSANVSFTKINLTQIQAGQSPELAQTVVYTEPMSLVLLRSVGVAFVYIFVFLFIGWYAFKRAQILE